MVDSNGLAAAANEVAARLKHAGSRIVFAESCTAGLISASLGLVPGISGHLCGSAVVYREQTKVDWLAADPETLSDHSAVSHSITEEIARGVLEKTQEADISLGITGHFGPNAPDGMDGVVFVAVCLRGVASEPIQTSAAKQFQLASKSRPDRQQEAALLAFQFLLDVL